MPRKFSAHVALSDGAGVHTFGPGDEVPGWAKNVGEHVLAPLKGEVVEEDDTVEDVVEEEQGTPAPTVDFTKPVEKRGPGRPRKQV